MGGDDYYISKAGVGFGNGTDAAHHFEDALIRLETQLAMQDHMILQGYRPARAYLETKDGLMCPVHDLPIVKGDMRLGHAIKRGCRSEAEARVSYEGFHREVSIETREYVLDRFIGSANNRVPVYREQ